MAFRLSRHFVVILLSIFTGISAMAQQAATGNYPYRGPIFIKVADIPGKDMGFAPGATVPLTIELRDGNHNLVASGQPRLFQIDITVIETKKLVVSQNIAIGISDMSKIALVSIPADIAKLTPLRVSVRYIEGFGDKLYEAVSSLLVVPRN